MRRVPGISKLHAMESACRGTAEKLQEEWEERGGLKEVNGGKAPIQA